MKGRCESQTAGVKTLKISLNARRKDEDINSEIKRVFNSKK